MDRGVEEDPDEELLVKLRLCSPCRLSRSDADSLDMFDRDLEVDPDDRLKLLLSPCVYLLLCTVADPDDLVDFDTFDLVMEEDPEELRLRLSCLSLLPSVDVSAACDDFEDFDAWDRDLASDVEDELLKLLLSFRCVSLSIVVVVSSLGLGAEAQTGFSRSRKLDPLSRRSECPRDTVGFSNETRVCKDGSVLVPSIVLRGSSILSSVCSTTSSLTRSSKDSGCPGMAQPISSGECKRFSLTMTPASVRLFCSWKSFLKRRSRRLFGMNCFRKTFSTASR